MSDEDKVASGQDTQGQSASQAPAKESVEPVDQQQAQTSQQEAQTQTFTREEAQRMVDEAVKQMQSYSDKGRIKLQQRMESVEQTILTAEEYGKPFSQEEQDAMRSKAFNAAMKDASQEETARESAAPRVNMQYPPSEFYAEGFRLEGRHGFSLDERDPEMAMIKITGRKETDLQSLREAWNAKAERLSQKASPKDEDENASADASRVPVKKGGQANSYDPKVSSLDYLESAHRK